MKTTRIYMAKAATGDTGEKQRAGRKTYRERQGARVLPRAQRRRAHVLMAEVDNPYYNPAHQEDATNPKRVQALRNANESPLVLLHSRGTIDDLQAAAGVRFRMLFERVMAGTPSPGDIKERVDSSGRGDMMSEGRMQAGRDLREAVAYIGRSEYWVVRTVCGEGRSLRDVAKMAGVRRDCAKAALRCGLDRLAEVWNLAAKGHAEKRRRAA